MTDESNRSAPFAAGSVSIRLYPHNELDATSLLAEICAQGAMALDGGFDGVMTSEHHGGVGGYLPNPLQVAGFILEDSPNGWAAPCPLLLPLRPTAMVAEEVAWLDARHPGRVGLGVGSGAMALDFESMGLDVANAATMFKAELPRIVDMLRGADLHGLDADRAFQRVAQHPIPVLSAAVSVTASKRAARCGAGLILEGMSPVEHLARLCQEFDQAGGSGSKVVIRRVWLGRPLTELIEKQRGFYASAGNASARTMGSDQTVTSSDGREMAEILASIVSDCGADAINLRIHLPGIPAEAVREQIAGLCSDVVPHLRARLSDRTVS